MAGYADDKTEAPTPRRRQEARVKGQVARSQDLTAAGLLLGGFLALYLFGPAIWFYLLGITRAGLGGAPAFRMENLWPFAASIASEGLWRVFPFLLALSGVMLVVLLAQIGWLFTLQPLVPSLSKISPLKGLRRLFSARSVVQAVINLGKLLVVGAVAYITLTSSAAAILYATSYGHHDLFRIGASLVFSLALRLGLALLLLALFDYVWQRHRTERDMRMTKEEVKDEIRSMEGDPLVRRRRREVQLHMAMQRLRRDVPAADVVVTNPTHVAVAIKYDPDTMVAPKVVAKGADYLALRIRQIASEFTIPIVQRPPLARAVYEAVDVGEYVPEKLYRAIAEILAYVYELTGRSPRSRGALQGERRTVTVGDAM